MARPSLLKDERLVEEFCHHLHVSGSEETAIQRTGIGRETYYGWIRQYKQKGRKCSPLVRRFAERIEQTIGERKGLVEALMLRHADKQWMAAAWWLERKFPQEYSRPAQRDAESPETRLPPAFIVETYQDDDAPLELTQKGPDEYGSGDPT